MDYPLISQSPIDGRWEARFDGLELASMDYDKLENAISELVNWRAQQNALEHSHDEWEQQRAEDQEGLTIEPWAMFAFIVLMVGVLSVLAYFGW
jgi:hypothetical protein